MSESINSGKVFIVIVEKSLEGVFLDWDDAVEALDGRKGQIMTVLQVYRYNGEAKAS